MKTQIPNLHINKSDAEIIQLWKPSQKDIQTYERANQNFLNPALFTILNQSPCITWILDVRTRKFIFISDNISDLSGHELDAYREHGLEFHESLVNPDDMKIIRKFMVQIWQVLEETPVLSRAGYKFSFDYRILNSNGKEIRILEQNSVFQHDSIGNITHLMGVCSDITHWKKSSMPLAILESVHEKKQFVFMENNLAIHKSKTILSKRELEIAKLMAEGRSSKFIADKLFISFHTVNTHRKNMIEKTRCNNTVGLVQFVLANGLI